MSLMIDLTPAEEAQLEAAARQKGLDPAALVKKLVAEHLPSINGQVTVHASSPYKMTPEEMIRALDELAEMNRDLPVLPPEAFERESIYEDY